MAKKSKDRKNKLEGCLRPKGPTLDMSGFLVIKSYLVKLIIIIKLSKKLFQYKFGKKNNSYFLFSGKRDSVNGALGNYTTLPLTAGEYFPSKFSEHCLM